MPSNSLQGGSCCFIFPLVLPILLSLSLSLRAIELFFLAIRRSQVLFSFLFFPPPSSLPPSPTGTMSLPWLGGCNLLQAAGHAKRSPSYLDRGSPGKSYQREGVFKYGRNCSNHFLLSLQPPTSHFLKTPPPLPLTFSCLPFHNSPTFSPWLFRATSPLPQRFLLQYPVNPDSWCGLEGADSCMTRNVSLCKSLLPPCAVLA